jgi:hypothetical protein
MPDAVAQRAQDLFVAWTQQGLKLTPQDAANFALGEAVTTGKYKPMPRQDNGQFAPANPVLSAQSGPPAAARAMKPLPVDYDRRSPEQQLQLLESRGAGDMEI